MSGKQREIYAAYGGLSASDLGRIMGDRKLNPFTQAELLASALAMPFKETGRAHYRSLVQEQQGYPKQIADGLSWLERLGLEQLSFDGFAALPRYSFALELQFVLDRPYLSQDDDAFYIIDNPVRKDKVFKVPYVAPTSWKGSLRAVATRGLLDAFARLLPADPPIDETERGGRLQVLWAERARRVVLFGNEKENKAEFINGWLEKRLDIPPGELAQAFKVYLIEHGYRTEKIKGRQGRLSCFPTFFNQIDLEIINPHDRARRVGKNPILFECVPAGATGTFRLLYVPYDFPGEVTPDETTLQADLPLVAKAVCDLLSIYGFGAKTSSGFGVAKGEITGRLLLNCEDPETSVPKRPREPGVPKQVEAFWEKYPGEEFEDKPNAWRKKHGATSTERNEYKKARAAYRKYQKRLRAFEEKLAEWEAVQQEPPPTITERSFNSFDEMLDVVKTLSVKLG